MFKNCAHCGRRRVVGVRSRAKTLQYNRRPFAEAQLSHACRTTMVQIARSPRLTRLACCWGAFFHKVFHRYCEDLESRMGTCPKARGQAR